MFKTIDEVDRHRGIAFVGTYLPRQCGIATFTHDLVEAVVKEDGKDQTFIVAAMNDQDGEYAYPDRVKFEIRADYQVDYSRAADFLNFNRVDVVSLQHEFGIFGGKWGANVLALMRELNRPVVVTCHTVKKAFDPMQQKIFMEIAALADKLVVMSEKAADFLEHIHGIKRDKIVYIPHGVHEMPFIDPTFYKDKFGVEGRKVLLTFGLLHRKKGIEYLIEALPQIIEHHPRVTYLVLGATHPRVLQKEGEAYRLSLQRRVRELGLEEYVHFHQRFVELEELLEYIGATDIFVTPYTRQEQITSGAMSYAMGMGKAVVSTQYWHAAEALADGRGRLVPMNESGALAREIVDLLDDEVTLNAMRKKAYGYCRDMTWSKVALSYLDLFEEVRARGPRQIQTNSAMRRPIAATNLPMPKIDHLLRLCDGTGVARYAHHTTPDWRFGYNLEDAAATLVVSIKFNDIFGDRDATRLGEVCLSLLLTLIGDTEEMALGLDYSRRKVGQIDDVALGKTLWGLGYVIWRGPSSMVSTAHDLFHQMLSVTDISDPRGACYAVLGAANYLRRFPGASQIQRCMIRLSQLIEHQCATSGWIDHWPGSDWGIAVQALAVTSRIMDQRDRRETVDRLVDQVLARTREGTVFWRQADQPDRGELPVTAATVIEALGAVFYDRRNPELLRPIRAATDWFLGANRSGESLYDFATGGCYDALTAVGLNRNQGAESTVFCLLAFLTLHRLAGIETTPQKSGPLRSVDRALSPAG